MIRITILLAAIFFSINLVAQTYEPNDYSNGDTVFHTCGDVGGFNSDEDCGSWLGYHYCDNQDVTVTICSSTGDPIGFTFYDFALEADADSLYIYDNTAGVYWALSGSYYPFEIISEGSCLTFRFVTDASGQGDGFFSNLQCFTPCNGNEPATDFCEHATAICNLNGYCGNTSSYYTGLDDGVDQPGNMDHQTTDLFEGSIENNSWLVFTANDDTASFHVEAYSCSMSNGIQMGIYEGTNCDNFILKTDPDLTFNAQTDFIIEATDLTPGLTYYIMVDGYGGDVCTYEVEALSGVATANVDIHNATITCGDSIQITGSGGAGYSWTSIPNDPGLVGQESNTTISVAPLVETQYILTVTSGNPLCPDAATDTSIISIQPLTTDFTVETPICNGETSTITYTGVSGSNPTYTWDFDGGNATPGAGQGPQNVSWDSTGSYSVELSITNNACISDTTINTVDVSIVNAVVDSLIDPSCGGSMNGYISIGVNEGQPNYTYEWSHNAGVTDSFATGLDGGDYQIVVTDANGCHDTVDVTLNVNPSIAVSIINTTDVYCFGGSNGTATAHTTGGLPPYNYTWSPTGGTGQTGTGLQANITYTVVVQDSVGCTDTTTVSVNQPTELIATLVQDSLTHVTCFGDCDGSAYINVIGGTPSYQYFWVESGDTLSNGSNQGLCAENYHVYVRDSLNCRDTVTFNLNEPDSIEINFNYAPIACNTDTSNTDVTANVTGGTPNYNIVWSDGQSTATANGILGDSIYWVNVSDSRGCTNSDTIYIQMPPQLVIDIDQTNVLCYNQSNGTATANVTGGNPPYNYVWNDPNGQMSETATGLEQGPYIIIINDANGCVITDTVIITEPAPLAIDSTTTENVLCYGGTTGVASIYPSGGTEPYNYSFDGGTSQSNNMRNDLSAGEHVITVTDSNGCINTDTVDINQPTQIQATITIQDVLCNNGSSGWALAEANGGIPPYTINWYGETTSGDTAVQLIDGFYPVEITDANGCVYIDTAYISQPDAIIISDSMVNDDCAKGLGEIYLTINGGTIPYAVDWNEISTASGQSATQIKTGDYTIYITDANGCEMPYNFFMGNEPCDVIIPNVFSPNNDGKNDVFSIKYLEQYDNVTLTIYNRWGNELIYFSNYQNNWDGRTASGSLVSDGVYFYLLKFDDGTVETGNVTIIK